MSGADLSDIAPAGTGKVVKKLLSRTLTAVSRLFDIADSTDIVIAGLDILNLICEKRVRISRANPRFSFPKIDDFF